MTRGSSVVLALATLACAPRVDCSPRPSIVVHAQTVAGLPLDDVTVDCGPGIEAIPLGDGDHACGESGGRFALRVTRGARTYEDEVVVATTGPNRDCLVASTVEVAIVFPDP